ncbi:HEPN domain-containing protein [Neobacillus drentensis]|uniref:HEPN domain-containing protein n=1 Tax=Neobacillus drentensis TaxID=220684 RepID=UPI001EEA9951|nr:HEPN domain-containing protein [Neobacillus drentensis]ULT58715.1 HEPN domain-containing protein [Neobacillus drentensis]
MKFYFVASIYNLEIDRVLNRGINVIEGIRLSNSKTRLDTFIDDFFTKLAGQLEVDELYDKPFLYYEGNINEAEADKGEKRFDILDYYLKIAQTFSNYLWTSKDNSVTVQQGFLYVKYPDGSPHSMTSNMRTALFFNSKCQRENIRFTNEELKELVDSIESLDKEKIEKETHEMSMLVSKTNRIERFYYFLQATRTQTHLPSRIGMYCTLLETLLSTDKDEITHKIAERLARILGETYEERLEIFTFIKNAYAVRSSTIHGDKLSKKFRDIDKLREMSSKFDQYLRSLFGYILHDEKLNQIYKDDNNDKLNEWFKEIILK